MHVQAHGAHMRGPMLRGAAGSGRLLPHSGFFADTYFYFDQHHDHAKLDPNPCPVSDPDPDVWPHACM